jgi:hypothetical protein
VLSRTRFYTASNHSHLPAAELSLPLNGIDMLISLPLLLATVVLTARGDTTKKKAPESTAPRSAAPAKAPQPATSKAPVVQAGAPVAGNDAPSPASQPLAGKAIVRSVARTARAVAPRATYLARLIRNRASRGPALPAGIRRDPNSVPFSADSIVVEKSRRTMTLYKDGSPVRIYFIALGQNPLGDKVGIGDNRTPEGLYYIEGHNPASKYHLSLRVSYPNDPDIAEARSRGLAPGGDIMVHGLPRGFENVGAEHRQRDWTNGCIAVTNAEIEEIWSAIPDGAAIQIKP